MASLPRCSPWQGRAILRALRLAFAHLGGSETVKTTVAGGRELWKDVQAPRPFTKGSVVVGNFWRKMFCALAFIVLTQLVAASSENLSDAVARYDAEDCAGAYPLFRELAHAGEPEALY